MTDTDLSAMAAIIMVCAVLVGSLSMAIGAYYLVGINAVTILVCAVIQWSVWSRKIN